MINLIVATVAKWRQMVDLTCNDVVIANFYVVASSFTESRRNHSGLSSLALWPEQLFRHFSWDS